LRSGCEQELVVRTRESAKSQAIELEHAFEELAQDASRLRFVGGHAAAGAEGRQGANRNVLTARMTERPSRFGC
jgi:hypothetical protein